MSITFERDGPPLPEGVVLHVLGELHEEVVAVRVAHGEEVGEVDAELPREVDHLLHRPRGQVARVRSLQGGNSMNSRKIPQKCSQKFPPTYKTILVSSCRKLEV